MGELPSRQDDEKLVRELNEDAEEVERTRDPAGLGDPDAGKTVRTIADRRSRS